MPILFLCGRGDFSDQSLVGKEPLELMMTSLVAQDFFMELISIPNH